MFKPWRFSKTSIKLETSFWLKGGRGFRKCIPSNHPITYQRYKKGNRHTARSIRNIPHDYWSNRTTHYRHVKHHKTMLSAFVKPSALQTAGIAIDASRIQTLSCLSMS